MEKAKIDHDRLIRKYEYKIGDLVLTDHPKLKKGLSHGLAHKFYGPFVIVGINENKIDYFIRLYASPRSKIRQVHKNRLKAYFHSGVPLKIIKEEPEEHLNQPQKNAAARSKRKYVKDPNNPRWKNRSVAEGDARMTERNNETSSEVDSSCPSSTENDEIRTNSKALGTFSNSNTSTSSLCDTSQMVSKKKKVLSKKKLDNRQTQQSRRSTRLVKAPERLNYH
jgi:hypothetical protein